MQAQWLMLQQETPRDYIIATGVKHSVEDLCRIAFNRVGLDYREYVIESEQYKRPAELHSLQAKCDKAKLELDWQATMSFKDMIELMVDEDIKRHL